MFSVVMLQDLHNLICFLPLQYVGVFSKCKESSVTRTYIADLLDILGDRERRNHSRFLLKYILPWLLVFLWKYWNLCGKIVPDLIMVTGLAFKICILKLFYLYSFRPVNDIWNASGSIFHPHEIYFVYLAEYTLLYLFLAAGFEKHFQCEGIELCI